MVAALAPDLEAYERIYPVVIAEPEPMLELQQESKEATLERLTGLTTLDRDAMITHHLSLVRYVAGTMARHANASSIVDYEDLVGYGTEGLIDAVESFNPADNVRFSTWAVMHIRTTIQDALRVLDPLPRSLRSCCSARMPTASIRRASGMAVSPP